MHEPCMQALKFSKDTLTDLLSDTVAVHGAACQSFLCWALGSEAFWRVHGCRWRRQRCSSSSQGTGPMWRVWCWRVLQSSRQSSATRTCLISGSRPLCLLWWMCPMVGAPWTVRVHGDLFCFYGIRVEIFPCAFIISFLVCIRGR